ncbi:MAG: hypothetical protein RR069_04965 [Oscillospiraceae bacterium]
MASVKMVFSSLLIAIVIIIETVVIYSGESLVAITILSTIPLYFICRIDLLYGWLSFLSVGILLLIISPHQMMFFVCTNGLVGTTLGISKVKSSSFVVQSIACSIALYCGLCVVVSVLGIESFAYKNWYYILAVIAFCVVYSTLWNFMLARIYDYAKKITKLEIL